MKIELKKNMKLYKMEFVGEVDFFEKSPYIDLLKEIKTKDELINELKSKDMPQSAIKNIIKNLESLKVLVDNKIIAVKDGFPEKEYGKFLLEIFENDTPLPFKYKNKDIKREKAVSKNIIDDIEKNLDFIKRANADDTSRTFSDNKAFKINKIENNKAKYDSLPSCSLTISYEKNNWNYSLENKRFNMQAISFDELFKGEWDEEYGSLKIAYSLEKDKDIEDMKYSYLEDLELEEYGKLSGEFHSIPIIPKTKTDAKEWFLHLLKKEIEEKNRYISKDDLEQIWYNLLDNKPKFKKFDKELKFDFEMILKEFGKESKYYWLLKAGIDLYPFDNTIPKRDRILIESLDSFNHFSNTSELIILDRYINTLRHFEKLEKILKILNIPSTTIITTDTYDKNQEKIEKIINIYNIKRVIKEKHNIPHSRYWIFNNKTYYKVSESLDGIEKTSFDLYNLKDIKKIDSKVIELLEGNINE